MVVVVVVLKKGVGEGAVGGECVVLSEFGQQPWRGKSRSTSSLYLPPPVFHDCRGIQGHSDIVEPLEGYEKAHRRDKWYAITRGTPSSPVASGTY